MLHHIQTQDVLNFVTGGDSNEANRTEITQKQVTKHGELNAPLPRIIDKENHRICTLESNSNPDMRDIDSSVKKRKISEVSTGSELAQEAQCVTTDNEPQDQNSETEDSFSTRRCMKICDKNNTDRDTNAQIHPKSSKRLRHPSAVKTRHSKSPQAGKTTKLKSQGVEPEDEPHDEPVRITTPRPGVHCKCSLSANQQYKKLEPTSLDTKQCITLLCTLAQQNKVP